MTLLNLREFSYDDKFRMSFNNILIFTGRFINSTDKNLMGKNLYIPMTKDHPTFTLKITGEARPGLSEISSLIIHFNSATEREAIACYDFTNEIFYVDI